MGLREELPTRRHHEVCSLVRIRQQLSTDEQHELDELLADPTVVGSDLTSVLRGRGFAITSQSLQRHRRRACACPT